MTQKITPYWIGNVAHVPMPEKPLFTGPDDTASQYGSTPVQKPLAEVLPMIAPAIKDVPER